MFLTKSGVAMSLARWYGQGKAVLQEILSNLNESGCRAVPYGVKHFLPPADATSGSASLDRRLAHKPGAECAIITCAGVAMSGVMHVKLIFEGIEYVGKVKHAGRDWIEICSLYKSSRQRFGLFDIRNTIQNWPD